MTYEYSKNYNPNNGIKAIKHSSVSNSNNTEFFKPKEPIVSCHYCHSTNTNKIGIVKRSVSFGLFGFGGGKIGKQFHCNNCGARWKYGDYSRS